jgi:hypothetical protein
MPRCRHWLIVLAESESLSDETRRAYAYCVQDCAEGARKSFVSFHVGESYLDILTFLNVLGNTSALGLLSL